MKKTALILSASALSLVMSGAFAAGAGEKSPQAGAGAMDQQAQLDPSSSYRASDLMDVKVKNSQDQDLGTISELIVDKDGKVSHVVLQESGTLGMGEKKYVVPWDRVSITSPDEVLIDVNPDELSSEFAAFDEEIYEQSDTQRQEDSGAQKSPGDTGGGSY
ncbi:MAG: PRC-barrel domain-containing protein [Thiohalomonadaceae bacterium]